MKFVFMTNSCSWLHGFRNCARFDQQKKVLGFRTMSAYIVHHTGSWYTALGMTVAKTFERLLTCHRWRKLALPLGGQRPGTTNIALATRNKLLIRKVNMRLLINYGKSTYSQAT